MLKRLFFACIVMVFFNGCLKNSSQGSVSCSFDPCGAKAPASEIQSVQDYLTANNITNATQHCSGMFYVITAPGTGVAPTVCNGVNVTYKGQLTNGTVFDQGTTTLALSNVIRGWQNGVPLIKEGGNVRLYIPPSLGYGSQQVGSIPANSILIFDVTLNTVY